MPPRARRPNRAEIAATPNCAYIGFMFGDILRRLTAADPQPLTESDARQALAALLVRVARTDGVYARSEIERIDRVLSARYGLSPFEATALRREGEALEAQAPDTVRFTRVIKDTVAYEDRRAIMTALWRIALADGARAPEEDALLRLAAKLLGVNDVDNALARQEAERT